MDLYQILMIMKAEPKLYNVIVRLIENKRKYNYNLNVLSYYYGTECMNFLIEISRDYSFSNSIHIQYNEDSCEVSITILKSYSEGEKDKVNNIYNIKYDKKHKKNSITASYECILFEEENYNRRKYYQTSLGIMNDYGLVVSNEELISNSDYNSMNGIDEIDYFILGEEYYLDLIRSDRGITLK